MRRPVLKRALADVVVVYKLEDTVVLLVDIEIVSIMYGPGHEVFSLGDDSCLPESLPA